MTDLAQQAKHSSASKEHFTPPEITMAAHRVMGDIDLDPASSLLANRELVVAKKFYDAETNGFDKEWHGRVFLNPPGGKCDDDGISLFKREGVVGYFYADGKRCEKPARSSAVLWWKKLVHEWKVDHVQTAIFVGFSIEILQSSQVAGMISCMNFPICVPGRRLSFWSLNTSGLLVPAGSPTHANVIVYLSHLAGPSMFVEHFSPIGACR
jgi:hypothetical protein